MMAKAIQTAFRIPTIEEVRAFMNLCKPDWPTNFIAYYSDRWMAHYMANGFVVGRVKMKDWKACIRSQWLTLKFKEDKEFLDRSLMEPIHRMRMAREQKEKDGLFADAAVGSAKPISFYLEFYETLRQKFLSGAFTTPWKELAPHYDRLKAIGIMRLPKHQTDQILVDMGNNRDIGKGMAVMRLFLNLQEKGLTVGAYHELLTKKMQEQQL